MQDIPVLWTPKVPAATLEKYKARAFSSRRIPDSHTPLPACTPGPATIRRS